ncbi:hypothetical protein MTR67_017237 [Solanum verrucosum]|uniref:Uncharacterized protein n=1 Tax=Solanum verrucosum TaxID=315347 RepID=A0AAF0QJC9_SOLVR|nr:hypothetical protein MTR67_017237 [Solanum verrucosum]
MGRITIAIFALFIILSSLFFNPISSSRDITIDKPTTYKTLLSQQKISKSDYCSVCVPQCGSCTCCIAINKKY